MPVEHSVYVDTVLEGFWVKFMVILEAVVCSADEFYCVNTEWCF